MSDDVETPNQGSQETNKEAATERSFSLLASEMFGADFHGEVKQPEQSKPSGSEPEQPEETPETPETPEEPDEPEQPEEPNEPGDDSVASVIRQSFEANPKLFDEIKVAVKIDGTPAEVSLSDLKNSYQIQEAAEKRLADAKSKAKQTNEELQAKSQELNGHYAVVGELIKQAEAVLDKDIAEANLAKLREDDPAEYSARKADLAERRANINKLKQEAAQSYVGALQKATAEQRQMLEQRMLSEGEKLIQAVPALKESKTKAQLAEYLLNSGFSQQEIATAADHRMVVLAHKARLYDELTAKSTAAKKKVTAVPKVLKPGTPKPQEKVTQERIDKQRLRLGKTGSLDDAFALLQLKRGNHGSPH